MVSFWKRRNDFNIHIHIHIGNNNMHPAVNVYAMLASIRYRVTLAPWIHLMFLIRMFYLHLFVVSAQTKDLFWKLSSFK